MSSAWLQLLFAPRGVQVTPVERTPLLPGEALALAAGGRSIGAEGELRVSNTALARQHCRIQLRDGRWVLSHAAPELRTLVNGTWRSDATLENFDVVELPGLGPVFRLLTAPLPLTEAPPREVQLDDTAALAVWADALQEAGEPLGERLARALKGAVTSEEDDRRWLGPLARALVEGHLEVRWRDGLLESAVLRDVFGREPLTSLEQLLRLPVAQCLESLTVDAGGATSSAVAFGEVLRHVGRPRSLRRLHFGDCLWTDARVEPAGRELRRVLAPVFPRLSEDPLFGQFRAARLVVTGVPRESTQRVGEVHPLEDAFEVIELVQPSHGNAGPASVGTWRLERKHAHWELAPVPPSPLELRLNGRPVNHASLRDQDLIELPTGLALRFELER